MTLSECGRAAEIHALVEDDYATFTWLCSSMLCSYTTLDERQTNEPGFRRSVASYSLGVMSYQQQTKELIRYASAARMHFFVAAGNGDKGVCMASPVRMRKGSDAATVGNINVEDRCSPTSNFGPCVTLDGPGENITSTSASWDVHGLPEYRGAHGGFICS